MAERPHQYHSFAYKVFDKRIKQALVNRAMLDNTVQVGMPFIKATTTIELPEYLGPGNIGFTLGMHAHPTDVEYQNIFAGVTGKRNSEGTLEQWPLIGYTYKIDGTNELVYADIVPESPQVESLKRFFNRNQDVVNEPEPIPQRFSRIPPPGITQATIGRNKNGLLVSAQLQISVPSIQQLEVLHRTFLIPGCGMIVEWGQQFATTPAPSQELSIFEETGLTEQTINNHMFPWYNRSKLKTLLERIGRREVGMDEILEDYVYPTQGQYMWMFGRIANFTVNTAPDNSFQVMVKIVGPSEDSWAYTTKNTIVPGKNEVGETKCILNANSLESYFTSTAIGGENFSTLLSRILSETSNPWNKHVYHIQRGNASKTDDGIFQNVKKAVGFKNQDLTKQQAKEENFLEGNRAKNMKSNFAEIDDAYFVSWRFFVNMVINGIDPKYPSLLQIFKKNMTPEQFDRVALLRPYLDPAIEPSGDYTSATTADAAVLDDPYENFVGFNEHLRTTDPRTLVLMNPVDNDFINDQKRLLSTETIRKLTNASTGFVDGDSELQFHLIKNAADKFAEGKQELALLSTGVLLNHRAIVESMAGADTFLQGITNLLQRMNNITQNYWGLSLDMSEPVRGARQQAFLTRYSYGIVDTNFRENSNRAVKIAVGDERSKEEDENRLYTFNKITRKRSADNMLVGSDLIECEVDLSLPKRLFAQIATMGLHRKEDKNYSTVAAGGDVKSTTALLADPNETFRQMFGITTLSPSQIGSRGPDLTMPSFEGSSPDQCTGQIALDPTGFRVVFNEVIFDEYTRSETIRDKPFDLNSRADRENLSNFITENILDTDTCKQCTDACTPKIVETNTDKYKAVNTALTDDDKNSPLVEVLALQGKTMVVRKANGKVYKRSGDRSWRNNNPNNLVCPGPRGPSTTTAKGYLGCDLPTTEIVNGVPTPWRARIYDTRENGLIAMANNLESSNYRNKTLQGIVETIAAGAPVEVPTQYLANMKAALPADFDFNKIWSQFTEEEKQIVKNVIIKTEGREETFIETLVEVPEIVEDSSKVIGKNVVCDKAKLENATFFGLITSPIAISACEKCVSAQELLNQLNNVAVETQETRQTEDKLEREFYYLEFFFKFLEFSPTYMISKIRNTSDQNRSNAFGTAPGSLSISADLVLPGINGLRVGELFWIDRIPQFYKAFGAFQILSLEDSISIDGWKTKIHARFNYLGLEWRNQIIKLLGLQNTL